MQGQVKRCSRHAVQGQVKHCCCQPGRGGAGFVALHRRRSSSGALLPVPCALPSHDRFLSLVVPQHLAPALPSSQLVQYKP